MKLAKRGYEGVGSDIAPEYSGAADGSAVTKMPYVQLDITDKEAVEKVLTEIKPGRGGTLCSLDGRGSGGGLTTGGEGPQGQCVPELRTSPLHVRNWTARWSIFPPITSLTEWAQSPGNRTARPTSPLNVYGETKLGGELAVSENLEKYFIVRIAWVFGVNGKNFIKTMLNLGKTHDKLTVVCDQIGTPTYTYDLARLLVDMIETEKYGYYHATNEAATSAGMISRRRSSVRHVEQGHTEYAKGRGKAGDNSGVRRLPRQNARLTPDWTRAN